MIKHPGMYDLYVEIETGELFRGDNDTKGFIKIKSHHIFQPFSNILQRQFWSLPRLPDKEEIK